MQAQDDLLAAIWHHDLTCRLNREKSQLPEGQSPVFCVSWHEGSSHIGHCGHGVVVVVVPADVVVAVEAVVVVAVAAFTVVVTSAVFVDTVVDAVVVADIPGKLEVS